MSNAYSLNNDHAVKIGLIINKFITNSIKHSLGDDNTLSIRLENTQLPHHYQLKYSDFGKRIEHDLMETSFGFRLINSLCLQLEDQFSYDKEGHSFIILF